MDFRSQLERMKFSVATERQSNDATKPIWLIFSPGTMTGKTLQNIEKKVWERKSGKTKVWEEKSVGGKKMWKKVWERKSVGEKGCKELIQ